MYRKQAANRRIELLMRWWCWIRRKQKRRNKSATLSFGLHSMRCYIFLFIYLLNVATCIKRMILVHISPPPCTTAPHTSPVNIRLISTDMYPIVVFDPPFLLHRTESPCFIQHTRKYHRHYYYRRYRNCAPIVHHNAQLVLKKSLRLILHHTIA